jgi:uncharacterized protein YbaA (DUF1428 family)
VKPARREAGVCHRSNPLQRRPPTRALSFAGRLSPGAPPAARRSHMEIAMNYVDGFVVPVPQANLAAYKRISRKMAKIWRELGALEFRECVADDVKVGKVTSFPQAVKLKEGEVVVFSWIVYKSKADRTRINKAAMKDPRLADVMDPKAMPFDGRRLFMGGFKMMIDA